MYQSRPSVKTTKTVYFPSGKNIRWQYFEWLDEIFPSYLQKRNFKFLQKYFSATLSAGLGHSHLKWSQDGRRADDLRHATWPWWRRSNRGTVRRSPALPLPPAGSSWEGPSLVYEQSGINTSNRTSSTQVQSVVLQSGRCQQHIGPTLHHKATQCVPLTETNYSRKNNFHNFTMSWAPCIYITEGNVSSHPHFQPPGIITSPPAITER